MDDSDFFVRQQLAPRYRKLVERLPLVRRALGMSWRAAPRLAAVWLATLIVGGLIPAASVHLTRIVVDAVAAGLETGALEPALQWAAALAGVMLAAEALRALQSWQRAALALTVEDHFADLVHGAALKADLAHFESPEFHDKLYRARSEARYRPMEVLENCGAVLQSSITLAAMALVLLRFGWWIPLLLLAATLPGVVAVARTYLREHEWRQRVTPEERKAWYYDWLITDPEPAAEMQLYGLGGYFRAAYSDIRNGLRAEHLDLARRRAWTETGAGVFALAVSAGSLILMVARTVGGRFSLGELAMFFQAFNQGLKLGGALLQNAGKIFTSAVFLENLVDVLDLKPTVQEPAAPKPLPEGWDVSFENVSFRYSGTSRPAVHELSLQIPQGQIVALLGPNGAGKTTLAKLLTRLYDVEKGRITVGGVDVRSLAIAELRSRIAVLAQRPMRFNATARENVQYGDVDRPASDETIRELAAVGGAGELIDRLPEGLETMLGRSFLNGAELSGGEWQRIATTRSMVRDAAILVMDEPTSAMDPWSEQEWLQRVRRFAFGRTVVVITHRLTTAMGADRICVMEKGTVVQQGTHSELLGETDGPYARAWRSAPSKSDPSPGSV